MYSRWRCRGSPMGRRTEPTSTRPVPTASPAVRNAVALPKTLSALFVAVSLIIIGPLNAKSMARLGGRLPRSVLRWYTRCACRMPSPMGRLRRRRQTSPSGGDRNGCCPVPASPQAANRPCEHRAPPPTGVAVAGLMLAWLIEDGRTGAFNLFGSPGALVSQVRHTGSERHAALLLWGVAGRQWSYHHRRLAWNRRVVPGTVRSPLARHVPQGVTLEHYQDFGLFDLWAEIRKLPSMRPVTAAETVRASGTDDAQAVVRPVAQEVGGKGVRAAACHRIATETRCYGTSRNTYKNRGFQPPMSDRAISSVGQSASLTRRRSQVQVLYRPVPGFLCARMGSRYLAKSCKHRVSRSRRSRLATPCETLRQDAAPDSAPPPMSPPVQSARQ